MKKLLCLTPAQLRDIRHAMAYLEADYETMSTEEDRERTRSVGNGIALLEQLIDEATPKPVPRVKCRCCGGREVVRHVCREGDRERVIVECKACETRRGEYTRRFKEGGTA